MKKYFLLIFLCSITFAVFSQNINIDNAINKLDKDITLKNAVWGLYAVNCNTHQVVCEHNANKLLTPASSLKLINSIAAYKILGDDFTFKTSLFINGTIDSNGVLNGDIIIKGGGDASLGIAKYSQTNSLQNIYNSFAQAIQNSGIKKVNGSIIADASLYNNDLPLSPSWLWEDIGNYYGSGVSALSYHENYFKVCFLPSKVIGGDAKILSIEPQLDYVNFTNAVSTAAYNTGDQVYIYGSPFENNRVLTGTVPTGVNKFCVKGSIPHPEFAFVKDFFTFLDTEINLSDADYYVDYNNQIVNNSKQIYTHKSGNIAVIIKELLKVSNNTLAESLLLACSLKQAEKGNYTDGIEQLTDFWITNGLDIKEFNISDACGLSRKNLVSGFFMTKALESFYNDDAFKHFLPLVKSYNISGKYCYLKSGSMDGVCSYTGYITNKDNQKIAITIIANNFMCEPYIIRKKLYSLISIIVAES